MTVLAQDLSDYR